MESYIHQSTTWEVHFMYLSHSEHNVGLIPRVKEGQRSTEMLMLTTVTVGPPHHLIAELPEGPHVSTAQGSQGTVGYREPHRSGSHGCEG